MATSSFKKISKPTEAEIISEQNPRALAVQDQPVALRGMSPAFIGSWSQDDVRPPHINLVHRTSGEDKIAIGGIGGFIFNDETKLSDGKTPVIVTALRALKDFVQKLPFGTPGALVFQTPEEVVAAGLTLKYTKENVNEGIYAGPRAHIQFLFAMPEGATEEQSAVFPYTFGEINYAKGVLTVSSSGFTSVARELSTLCSNNRIMRQGPQYGKLELTSKLVPHPANPWLIPVIKFAGVNTPEFIEFASQL